MMGLQCKWLTWFSRRVPCAQATLDIHCPDGGAGGTPGVSFTHGELSPGGCKPHIKPHTLVHDMAWHLTSSHPHTPTPVSGAPCSTHPTQCSKCMHATLEHLLAIKQFGASYVVAEDKL